MRFPASDTFIVPQAAIALLREVKGRGITIVIIEHVMRALMALSDRVLIMNQGKY